ncbi:hypothetical protein FPV67DRAFT_1447186 [Lyophyllum atratum]|nr:hypothetical protein FPV67DRAFT_1447186 [Lyophyllum atratum]
MNRPDHSRYITSRTKKPHFGRLIEAGPGSSSKARLGPLRGYVARVNVKRGRKNFSALLAVALPRRRAALVLDSSLALALALSISTQLPPSVNPRPDAWLEWSQGTSQKRTRVTRVVAGRRGREPVTV